MTRAAVYVRVSTEDQAKHGYSLGGQIELCRAKAASLGATAIAEYADEGVSGALLQRPGLSALRETLKAGAVDLVVVMDPDRLARNLSHQLLLTEELEKAKVRLEFVNFEWRNTAEGQLFYAVRGAIAQFEKEKIRERTSRGRQQKAKTGKLPLPFRPYGYDYNPDTALLTIHPEEAQVVRDMFRWLLEEGEGPNGIARRLNGLGIPAKKGGLWHRNVVRQILRNPVYTGTFYANRYDTTDMGLNRHRPAEERAIATVRPSEDWIPIAVPAIIEEERFHRAQRVLEQARRLWAGRPKADYLLSGLMLCGRCQMTMSGHNATAWGKRRRVYTCRRAYQGAPAGDCNTQIDAASVEHTVWERLRAWLQDPDALLAAAAQKSDTTAIERELGQIDLGLSRITRGRTNMMRLLEQGEVTAEAMLDSLQRLTAREQALQDRQQELRRLLAQGHPTDQEREQWRRMADQSLNRVEAMPAPERQRLTRILISRVIAQEQSLTVFARWPALFAHAPICNQQRDLDAPAQPEADPR